jgi:hypothetical protein
VPTPSTWAIGVAAPSYQDPYQVLEQSVPLPGGRNSAVILGAAGGESGVAPNRRLKGHISEMLDWKGSPAIWILAAILIAIGVLHLGGGLKAGPIKASLEA